MSTDPVTALLAEHGALVERVSAELAGKIHELVEAVLETFEAGGKLLFVGNGGSAADAQHLAAEYMIRFKSNREALPAIALTTDTSVLTAGASDLGFEHVYARQVEALARHGDLLVIHSTSGEPRSLIGAADAARQAGARTAALLAKGGGALKERVDLALVVPTDSTARAQEMHITIGHIVCELVDRTFAMRD
ncbi:MAG: SIS domain-containing protein [Gemmatimonadota bacterium]|nr:SIS domain-containing protein [Gemmatimonadota bacterium]MDH3421586.1 SIS domain-containing protein [Gemmatimonadota bacterium]